MNNSKNFNSLKVSEIVRELERENSIDYEISHRGGKYGARAGVVVAALFPTISGEDAAWIENLLPNNIGAYCNYLGGGLRGAIVRSDYSKELPAKYARRIDSFTRECRARYLEIENDANLNNEEYPDGETNWDAIGSNRSRLAGIKSAY